MLNPEARPEASPQSAPLSRRRNLTDGLIVTVLMIVAGVLRFFHISKKSFWFDEGVSVAIARLDWYNFARLLWRREANMSLYYLLLRAWLHFGHSETFIRTLSVLPAVATIPALYCLGRQLFDRRIGLVAAALLTVNAFHIAYSQEARSYTLFVLLSVSSVLFFIRSLQAPSPFNRRLHIAASVLAVYSHFFAVLLIIAQWLSLPLLDRESVPDQLRKNWYWIATLAAPVLIFVTATGAGPLAWIPRPGLRDVYTLFLWLCGDGGWFLLLICALSCAPALIAAGREPLVQRAAWPGWRYRFLLLWLVFPLVFIFLVSQARPLFLDRYFLFLLPALGLLAAAGLNLLPFRWLTWVGVVALIGLSLGGVRAYYGRDFDLEHEDWRSATHYVIDHTQAGDAIIFHNGMSRMPYEYYRGDSQGPLVIFPHREDKITFHDFYGHPDDALLSSASSRYRRVWLVLSHNQVGLGQGADPLTSRITQMFGTAFSAAQVGSFPGIEVRLYSGGAQMDRQLPPAAQHQ